MGKPTGFIEYNRKEAKASSPKERIKNFNEFHTPLPEEEQKCQAARCMDCGVPFCQSGMTIKGMTSGCPLNNLIPEWNDLVYEGNWERAYNRLHKTSNFPEFTSRVCPALCEKSCVLYHTTGEAVTNRENECAIAERAFMEGFVTIEHPERNGKKVAVIGGGPAGLAAANQLNYKGCEVTVFDRRAAAGGLLRYGIPNFKLEKKIIDRRISIMEKEGVKFVYNADIDVTALPEGFDAYVVSTGTPQARDINIPGRELKGVHLALELLSQQNQVLMGEVAEGDVDRVTAKDKDVLVIGGGDTGSDCIGTSHRQGAKSVTQIEIMPQPPVGHNPATPWPYWPVIMKTTSSHEEGCVRRWNINTLEFLGEDGKLTGVKVQPIDWKPNPEGGRPIMVEAGEVEVIKADIVFLAMGFLKPQQPQFADNVFVAGDAASGASLVVRAIASGRKTAEAVDKFLKKQ